MFSCIRNCIFVEIMVVRILRECKPEITLCFKLCLSCVVYFHLSYSSHPCTNTGGARGRTFPYYLSILHLKLCCVSHFQAKNTYFGHILCKKSDLFKIYSPRTNNFPKHGFIAGKKCYWINFSHIKANFV